MRYLMNGKFGDATAGALGAVALHVLVFVALHNFVAPKTRAALEVSSVRVQVVLPSVISPIPTNLSPPKLTEKESSQAADVSVISEAVIESKNFVSESTHGEKEPAKAEVVGAPGAVQPSGEPVLPFVLNAIEVPKSFLGMGIFPRRYRIALEPHKAGWRLVRFEPGAEAMPYLDKLLEKRVRLALEQGRWIADSGFIGGNSNKERQFEVEFQEPLVR